MNRCSAMVLAAAVLSFGAAPALAQTSSYPSGPYTQRSPQGYDYDPCKRETTSRGTAGGLIGAAMGAVIGSNVAARNARTEGAVLGGLIGAVAGGKIGNASAACRSEGYSSGSAYSSRSDRRYEDRADDRYDDRYDGGYSARAEADDDAWARADAQGAPYRVTERPPSAEDCTLAESPIRMPDGRTEIRFVRVCKGADGRYAVVD